MLIYTLYACYIRVFICIYLCITLYILLLYFSVYSVYLYSYLLNISDLAVNGTGKRGSKRKLSVCLFHFARFRGSVYLAYKSSSSFTSVFRLNPRCMPYSCCTWRVLLIRSQSGKPSIILHILRAKYL